MFRSAPAFGSTILSSSIAEPLIVLQAYAIVCTNVKFSVVSVDGGRTSTILTTQGSCKLRDNFCTIFSAKQAELLADFSCSGSDWHINGLFSKPIPNAGMASAERQFLFLNDRPIDFPKITRVCNEMYRRVSHSHPVFVLNIVTAAHNVDVNLTPDKRTVLLHNEIDIISSMQAYLKAMFEPVVQVFQVQTNTLDAFSTKVSKAFCSSVTVSSNCDATIDEVTDVKVPSSSTNSLCGEQKAIELSGASPSQSWIESSINDTFDANVSSPPRVDLHSRTCISDSAAEAVVLTNPDFDIPMKSSSESLGLSSNVEDFHYEASTCCDASSSIRNSSSDGPLHEVNLLSIKKGVNVEPSLQQDITVSAAGVIPSSDAVQTSSSFLIDVSTPTASMFSNFVRGSADLCKLQSSFIGSHHQNSYLSTSKKILKRINSSDVDSDSDDSILSSTIATGHSHSSLSAGIGTGDRKLQEHSSVSDDVPNCQHGPVALHSKRAKTAEVSVRV